MALGSGGIVFFASHTTTFNRFGSSWANFIMVGKYGLGFKMYGFHRFKLTGYLQLTKSLRNERQPRYQHWVYDE